jgi:hypothetical protein
MLNHGRAVVRSAVPAAFSRLGGPLGGEVFVFFEA